MHSHYVCGEVYFVRHLLNYDTVYLRGLTRTGTHNKSTVPESLSTGRRVDEHILY